jgi:hypothetical protein
VLAETKIGGGGHPPVGVAAESGGTEAQRAGDEGSLNPGPEKKQPSEIGEGRGRKTASSSSSERSPSELVRRAAYLLPANEEDLARCSSSERRPRRRPSAHRRRGERGEPVSPPKSPERRPRRCVRHIWVRGVLRFGSFPC